MDEDIEHIKMVVNKSLEYFEEKLEIIDNNKQ